MRILAVHLRNLNSLVGSWSIDFTAPEYSASGIFAITGPTGAGKSTILDAICLALFARTPRLGHISKSSNEILSRRAGDCFAEVEFATQQGRYRCHWGQHRARRSADGELQPPRHEIADALTGKVMETRTKEVSRLVEQVTGMDYDRFTRSMLLAQGGFAAFLEADADQRAPILEQITGTGIYSRISMAVHERTTEERKKSAILEESMGNVVLLGEEEEQMLATRIGEGIVNAAGLQTRLTTLSEALHRITTIESLQQQIQATDQLQLDLANRFELAQEDLGRYERGLQAQSLLGDYTRLQHLRERVAVLRTTVDAQQKSLQQLQEEQGAVAAEHTRKCQQLQEAVETQSRENEVLKTVRALDLRLFANRKAIDQAAAGFEQVKTEQQQQLQQRAALDQKLVEIVAQLEKIEDFFRGHGCDSLLVEHLAGFRGQLLQLQELEKGLTRLIQEREVKRTTFLQAQQDTLHLQETAATAGQALLVLHQRQERVHAELQTLLVGRNAAAVRLEIEQGEQQVRQLTQIGELLTRQRTFENEQTASALSLEQLRGKEHQQQWQLQTLEEKRQIQQQLLMQLEHNQLLAQRIHSYEEERRRLIDGDPCPLCGATCHPWGDQQPVFEEVDEALSQAKGELERMLAAVAANREALVGLVKDIEYTGAAVEQRQQQLLELEKQLTPLLVLLKSTEAAERSLEAGRLLEQDIERLTALRHLIKAVEQVEAQLQAVQREREQALAEQATLLQQVQAAQYVSKTDENEIRHLEDQHHTLELQGNLCRIDLEKQLQPLGILDCPPQQVDSIVAQLEARQQAWKQQQQTKEQLAQHKASLQGERDKCDLLLTTMDNILTQRSADLTALHREGSCLQEERLELYGDRNPDMEEQNLKNRVRQAEVREVEIRNRRTGIEKQLHALTEQQRVSVEELTRLLPLCQQEEAALLEKLPLIGFADMAAFCSALLFPPELAQLGTLKEQLDKEHTVLRSRKAEQTAALQREEEKNRGQKESADLLEEQKALNLELETLQQRIGADRERLVCNNLRKEEFAEHRLALAAQHKEQERWDLLHQLIGSADGKKFRVFAQGLTFDLMISHANRQLRKMNDRYILLRDPKEPLALQVIDNYQAGETRSTRNLSGGESFLVSLALSLGLSAMASHNVRVDSLFLDEGFGTLDEEALDTALQTLAELQHDGKLIGIISHVPMLKDRIDVRIQVLPGPGGCSRLIGPGCGQLS